jgi:NTE family protein
MHVARLLAHRLENESHINDIDFSPAGIRERWQAGWIGEVGPLDAIALHEPYPEEEREMEKLASAAE